MGNESHQLASFGEKRLKRINPLLQGQMQFVLPCFLLHSAPPCSSQPCPWVGPWAGMDLGTYPSQKIVCVPCMGGVRRSHVYQADPHTESTSVSPHSHPCLVHASSCQAPGEEGTRTEPAPGRCSPFWPWEWLTRVRGQEGWQESTCASVLGGGAQDPPCGPRLGSSSWGAVGWQKVLGQQIPGGRGCSWGAADPWEGGTGMGWQQLPWTGDLGGCSSYPWGQQNPGKGPVPSGADLSGGSRPWVGGSASSAGWHPPGGGRSPRRQQMPGRGTQMPGGGSRTRG